MNDDDIWRSDHYTGCTSRFFYISHLLRTWTLDSLNWQLMFYRMRKFVQPLLCCMPDVKLEEISAKFYTTESERGSAAAVGSRSMRRARRIRWSDAWERWAIFRPSRRHRRSSRHRGVGDSAADECGAAGLHQLPWKQASASVPTTQECDDRPADSRQQHRQLRCQHPAPVT